MRELKQIHCQILMSSMQHNKDIMDGILVFCTSPQTGDLCHAERVIESLTDPSLFVYNLMIKSFTKDRQPEKAILLFQKMRKACLSPDNFTFPLVLKALGEVKAMVEGRKVHAFIVKTGLEFDSYVRSSLIDMYAEMGAIEASQELFDEMPERNVIAWNVLIASYIKCCRFEDAISTFLKMEKSGVKLNEATLVTILSACVSLGDLEMGKKVHGYIENKEFKDGIPVNNAMLDMYSKCGCMNMARRVFDEMPSKDVISWTSIVSGYANSGMLNEARELFDRSPARDLVLWTVMINGYIQCNKFNKALVLFREMKSRRIKPDKFTVVALLSACANLGALEQGKWIHGFIKENKIRIDVIVGTALIDMYSKCGCVQEALEIFRRVEGKDTATWTSVIFGLAMNGESSEALKIFSEMHKKEAKPDDITFVGVLTACCHGGLVDEGLQCLHSMKEEYHIEPKPKHYGCLADLLGRAGLLEQAEKLIQELPYKNAKDILPFWSSLLGACRIHGNDQMVKKLERRIAKLESVSKANQWEDMTEMRRNIKDISFKTTQRCSSIEVNGIICEFLAGDALHPEKTNVLSVLSSLRKACDLDHTNALM